MHLLECAAALGPAAVTCTGAALNKAKGMRTTLLGLSTWPLIYVADPSKDASCIAAVANNVENTVSGFCCPKDLDTQN
jgi:hypothetical protein